MATFKELSANDVKTAKSFLTQLVDVVQEDISGSTTRKTYQVFVTGGVGPGITSSLFQTVHDQDHTLQTANAVLDMTVGLFSGGTAVSGSTTGTDSAGKLLFPSQSVMMREKVDVYRQMAQQLLGDADGQFISPLNSTTTSDEIEDALFITFHRLFARDQVKRETFAMKFFQSGSAARHLNSTSELGSAIFTDVGSAVNKEVTQGGQVSNIVDSSNTDRDVGLMFNDRGVAVLDLGKIVDSSIPLTGSIDAMNAGGTTAFTGSFSPNFLVSASIDDIVDHLASTRFGSGSLTAATFQNITNINSTLLFCRATADEFNYSSNPTFTDSDNRIIAIDEGQEETQRTFSFITSVGLYDGNDNLLAVAKLSRPVEKNDEKDITLRVRLDF